MGEMFQVHLHQAYRVHAYNAFVAPVALHRLCQRIKQFLALWTHPYANFLCPKLCRLQVCANCPRLKLEAGAIKFGERDTLDMTAVDAAVAPSQTCTLTAASTFARSGCMHVEGSPLISWLLLTGEQSHSGPGGQERCPQVSSLPPHSAVCSTVFQGLTFCGPS
jgi:hypothetical protein